MKYLNSFSLPDMDEEIDYKLKGSQHLDMTCYAGDAYPFGLFPYKELKKIEFAPITIFCGGNGSGKTTLLNIISEKLAINRLSPFNNSPCFEDYLNKCHYSSEYGIPIPKNSMIITSDDVFDFLIDIRSINDNMEKAREELAREYYTIRGDNSFRLQSLDDYDELKRLREIKHGTLSKYISKRVKINILPKSNGESAISYFTDKITQNALYLLDEPENSLSAENQIKLSQYIEDSVRFYNCQFIISSHSPFILSIKDAVIYNLDVCPANKCKWTDLENIKLYYNFFMSHKNEFL